MSRTYWKSAGNGSIINPKELQFFELLYTFVIVSDVPCPLFDNGAVYIVSRPVAKVHGTTTPSLAIVVCGHAFLLACKNLEEHGGKQMVRVTPLQWCSNLELANCGKEIFVLGRNLGFEGTLLEFCTDLMVIDQDGDWYSCTGKREGIRGM